MEISPIFHQPDHPITFLHYHNDMELGLCLSGRGIFMIGTQILNFEAGDLLAIPAEVPHLAQSQVGTSSSWIWFYFDFPLLTAPYFPPVCAPLPRGLQEHEFPYRIEQNRTQITFLLRELQQLTPGERESAAALTLLLWKQLNVCYSHIPVALGSRPPGKALERIQEALHYFSRNYRSPLSFAEAARLCHLSPVHFRRLFKSIVGISPQSYVHTLRIAMAQAELQNSRQSTIEEIATRCGYPTLSCFARQFKAHTGVTPGEYRKQHA